MENNIEDVIDWVIADNKSSETKNLETKVITKSEKKQLPDVFEAEVAEVVNTSFLVLKKRGKVSEESDTIISPAKLSLVRLIHFKSLWGWGLGIKGVVGFGNFNSVHHIIYI